MGMNPASARCCRRKLSMMSGISGPMMFVMNEITNQKTMMSATRAWLRLMLRASL